MERIRFIEHKGRRILHINYSNMKEHEKERILDIFNMIKNIVAIEPPNSVLIVSDVTNTYVDQDIQNAMVDMLKHNKPYIKKSAAIGVVGFKKIIYNFIMHFSKRNVKLFDDIIDAMDWLIED